MQWCEDNGIVQSSINWDGGHDRMLILNCQLNEYLFCVSEVLFCEVMLNVGNSFTRHVL